jgi:hypothetical protein
VIPEGVSAMERLVELRFPDWRMELLSTSAAGRWLVQLSSPVAAPLTLLLEFKHLAALCRSLGACIDAAEDPSNHPDMSMVTKLAATQLPTQAADDGAINVHASWSGRPLVELAFDGRRTRAGDAAGETADDRIVLGLELDDARKLSDMLTTVHNDHLTRGSRT